MADFENSTRTPVIKIGTTDAVKNVKDLRDNIKGLRDEIVALSNAEDRNADTEKAIAEAEGRLIQSQQELNRVMGITKKGADGVEGSYNNLKAQLREVKSAMDALPKTIDGQLNPAWDRLATKYKELNDAAKAYDFELGNFQRNVGNYGNALSSIGKSMGEVQQVGGDMVNGIQAMSGVLSIAGVATDGLDDGMKNLRLTVGLIQGAKGIAGLLKSLVKLVAGEKAATAETAKNTVANKANAQALTETAAAETAAATAGSVLRGVLMTLGIGIIVAAVGMLVAHLEDVANWLVKIGEKIGLIKKNNSDSLVTAEKLKENYEKQKDELDKQARIMQAQGKSQRDILKFQIQQIQASIDTKKAELESAKATVERLKSHNAIQRLLKGETKEYREAKKAVEELEEQIKSEEKTLSERQFDLTLEDYKDETDRRKKAVADAKKEAEDALKEIQNVFNTGIQAARKSVQAQETELQTIQREYKEIQEQITSAVTVTGKLTGVTEEQRKLLADGLTAAAQKYQKTLQDYYKKDFEQRASEYIAQQTESVTAQYETQERYEKICKDVLGYDAERARMIGKATAEQRRQYDILKETVDYLKNETLEAQPLDRFRGMTEKQIEEEIGQPLATAVKMYFEKSKELDDAGIAMAQTIFESYETAFQKRLDSGDFVGAREIATKFSKTVLKDFEAQGLGEEIIEYFDEVFEKEYARALLDSDAPTGFSPVNILFPQSDVDKLKNRVDSAKTVMTAAFEEIKRLGLESEAKDGFDYVGKTEEQIKAMERFWDAETNLANLEEQLLNKRLGRWNAFWGSMNKYMDSYGKATANLLGNVADAWEEGLKAQGKTNEEAFNGVRTLQYATAVINTAAAVVQALADPTVPSYYVKVANAAAAVAAGTAQVIKISQTKYGQDSSSSAPKLVDRTPQLQYTYGLNVADYAQAAAQTPVRAYIVDKDLADGMDNYQRREDETTF